MFREQVQGWGGLGVGGRGWTGGECPLGAEKQEAEGGTPKGGGTREGVGAEGL